MSFLYSPEQQRQWIEQNKPLVQEKLDEPVVAFSLFQRTNGYGQLAAHHISPLLASVMNAAAKKKAGGFPQSFMLVLTPTRLHAFAYKYRRSGIKVRDELAVWDRAGIQVSVKDNRLTKQLTIESPAEGERVVCEATKAAVTDDFIAALGAGYAAVAA